MLLTNGSDRKLYLCTLQSIRTARVLLSASLGRDAEVVSVAAGVLHPSGKVSVVEISAHIDATCHTVTGIVVLEVAAYPVDAVL